MTDLLPNRIRAHSRTYGAAYALAAAVMLSTGCASTINGRTQRVAVASDPPGAHVFIGDQPVGVTPTYLEFNRRDGDLALRFEKDCYRETRLWVPRRTSKWAAGNLLFAGAPVNDYGVGAWLTAMAVYMTVGVLVDRRRGGAFTFPNLVRATLAPMLDEPGATDPGGGVAPPGGCAPGASAERGDQGKTPSDR